MKGWFPRSTVVAFEASVRNYAEKCLYRAWTGITLIHAAVLNYDGVAFFYDSQGEYQGSGSALPPNLEQLRQYYPTMEFMPPYRVPAIRIDTFCRVTGCKPPDFLHIDAQGADLLVVQSLGSLRPAGVYMETSSCGEYLGSPASLDQLIFQMGVMGYRRVEQFANDALFLHVS
jgi:FkbM family methyltransferase